VWVGGRALLNQRVCRVRAIDGVADRGYLKHVLPGILRRIEDRTPFATVKHLSSSELEEEQIDLPTLSIQGAIGSRLDAVERQCELRRYAMTMSEGLLLSLLSDTLEGQLDRTNVERLGSHLEFITSGPRGWGNRYAKSGTRFIRSLDVRMNRIRNEELVYVDVPESKESSRSRVKVGDVLLTITGSRIGRVAPVPEALAGAFVSQHVAILRLKPTVNPTFVSWYLSLPSGGQAQIGRMQYGQTKPGLNLEQLEELKVPILDRGMLHRFLQHQEKCARLTATYSESVRQADHLFQTVLYEAFGLAGDRRTEVQRRPATAAA
jgi:type I restriction enzyme S subunit